jgi:glutamine amidotransferase
MIGIIDYKLSNINSVSNVLKLFNREFRFIEYNQDISDISMLILPGVGSFKKAMENLKSKNLDRLIKFANDKKIIIFGICLGMQLFYENSEEDGGSDGLGLIKGSVKLIKKSTKEYRVPNIGWRKLNILKKNLLFENIEDKSTFYFVHKYECITEDRNNLIANIDYSKKIDSVINFNNIYGTQFHPEKSQKTGIKLMHNLIQISE